MYKWVVIMNLLDDAQHIILMVDINEPNTALVPILTIQIYVSNYYI